jgi:hypothetical protein
MVLVEALVSQVFIMSIPLAPETAAICELKFPKLVPLHEGLRPVMVAFPDEEPNIQPETVPFGIGFWQPGQN